MKRRTLSLIPFSVLLISACVPTSTQPAIAPRTSIDQSAPMTGAEKNAVILRLEDRREFDADLIARLIRDADPAIRARAALALGRIGEATFLDSNDNGARDSDESQAGIVELGMLAKDPDEEVRLAAAFALGEIGDPSGIETLLVVISDDEDVAAEAIEALSKMPDAAPVERYLELASSDGRKAVRQRAIRYLFRIPGDPALETARVLLDDPSPEIRLEASYVFSRRPHPPARERLEAILRESDAVTRSYAARGLGRIGDSRSIGPLQEALDDPHPWVRINSARSIAQIASASIDALQTANLADHVARVIRHTDDPDSGTTVEAILTLGHYARVSDSAKQRLVEIARGSSRPWFREIALGSLAAHFGEAEPDLVFSLMDGKSRWQKIELLQNGSGHPSFGPASRGRFGGDDDPSVRATAVGSIPDDQVDTEIDLIRKAMDDDDVVVRASAIERFSKQTTDSSSDVVTILARGEKRARNDSMNDARLAAVRALAERDTDGRRTFLASLLGDLDPVIRRAAADLIEGPLEESRPQFTPLPIDRSPDEYRRIAEWSRSRHTATLRTGVGDIEVVLMTAEAPLTSWNFAKLARSGYFDDSSFMRVVPNFVIQGGDPRNDMSGGPGYAIRDEMNRLDYTRGAVGMALSGPDTGGSQFFITHSPQPHLDGGYTVFGRVISGLTHSVDEMNRADPVTTILIDDFEISDDTDVFQGSKIPLPLTIGVVDEDYLHATLPEYADRRDDYLPDEGVVDLMAQHVQPGDRIETVMGTWCSDSLREVPKLLKIARLLRENYGVEIPLSFVAVDRAKQRPADLIEGRNIEKVATFIYYRNGSEIGRIVESPVGLFEDDLLAIMAGGT